MTDIYEDLEQLCELAGKKIKEANKNIKAAQGHVSQNDVDYLDKLTHMMKSIKTTMAMMDGGYSENGGSYARGGSYDRGGNYDRGGSYDRGMSERRDSMGRFSRNSYDRGDNMVEELENLAEGARDERTKQEIKRLISKLEDM